MLLKLFLGKSAHVTLHDETLASDDIILLASTLSIPKRLLHTVVLSLTCRILVLALPDHIHSRVFVLIIQDSQSLSCSVVGSMRLSWFVASGMIGGSITSFLDGTEFCIQQVHGGNHYTIIVTVGLSKCCWAPGCLFS